MTKILLAEDNKLTRTTLGRFLRGNGYDVDLAEDGAQAVSLLNEKPFDLIISDIIMPKFTGWDVLDHVRSISPDTPVLLMTAYAQLQSRQAQSRSMPELILKPLVLSDLLNKIQQLLDHK
jgi:two-component system, NtrC family, response regulator PilR